MREIGQRFLLLSFAEPDLAVFMQSEVSLRRIARTASICIILARCSTSRVPVSGRIQVQLACAPLRWPPASCRPQGDLGFGLEKRKNLCGWSNISRANLVPPQSRWSNLSLHPPPVRWRLFASMCQAVLCSQPGLV